MLSDRHASPVTMCDNVMSGHVTKLGDSHVNDGNIMQTPLKTVSQFTKKTNFISWRLMVENHIPKVSTFVPVSLAFETLQGFFSKPEIIKASFCFSSFIFFLFQFWLLLLVAVLSAVGVEGFGIISEAIGVSIECIVIILTMLALGSVHGNNRVCFFKNNLSFCLQAFQCGCGCRFYDVGTCETRSKLECQVRLENKSYENCKMAIAISSSRGDSASVPGVPGFKWLTQAYWAESGI